MAPELPNSNLGDSGRPSFFDRSTIVAILIVMGFWFAWTKYMESKYPVADAAKIAAEADKPAASAGAQTGSPTTSSGTSATNGTLSAAAPATAGQPGLAQETFVSFADDRMSFEMSSFGMGIKDIDIKGYKTRKNEPIVLAHVTGQYPFSTQLVDDTQAVNFVIEKQGADTFVGHAKVNALDITKTVHVNTENFTLTTEIKVAGAATGFKGLQTVLSDNTEEAQSGGILSRSYDRQDWFVLHEGDKTRVNINREKGAAQTASSVEVTALSSHYFALAIADHSDLLPSFETSMAPLAPMAVGRLTYRPLNPADTFNVKYVGYAGPKSYNTLSTIDARLANVIDYGMFAIIARPLLLLMRFLFSVFGNWGVAIIVLTILVRLVVLPFNIFSTKSMKAMQRIQPEMNRIKERYKDKPADQKIQMNQEIMALMKQNKANPIGGCLPMLLQLPVFFALYQVLGQSIELYRAPFMLWIQDLSAKDPFFVLPALMGITMFVQQRITPSAMDPQQAKVMMWMPVIFTVFMVSLPSGLTLYIFVSTLFAIIQQFVLMRDRSPAGTIKEARA